MLQFLYTKLNYQPSEKECEISDEIDTLAASYNVKPETLMTPAEETTTLPTEETTTPDNSGSTEDTTLSVE